MSGYNVWCKWHPLKTVMLGDCYDTSYFNGIKNARIRSALQRITDETKQDLANFENVLKSHGVSVLRPKLNPHASILDIMNDQGQVKGSAGVPRSPLQPRDAQLVIGQKLYMTGNDHQSIMQELVRYDSNIDSYVNLQIELAKVSQSNLRQLRCIQMHQWRYIGQESWGTYDDYLKPDYFTTVDPSIAEAVLALHQRLNPGIDAPDMTLVGKDLYMDYYNYATGGIRQPLHQYHIDLINQHNDLRINGLTIGGHNDGVFHTLKPGAILSLRDIQSYADTFPGWDVCYLPNQSFNDPNMSGFLRMKLKVRGKWWVPGEEDNDDLINFVETWLQDWVGYAEESVFDVNVLMLDDRHVCVSNYNETAFEFFKKHQIEPIIVPWRHRYFWDGGLHCITLDLYREGQQEDYFPDRQGPVFDNGY